MKNFLLGVMTTVLCLVLTGANYQATERTNYEYKVVYFAMNVSTREKDLNNAAAGGWKLSSTKLAPGSGKYIYCFYEREKR